MKPTKTCKVMAGILLTTCVLSLPLQAGDPATNWSESCARCHGPDGRGQTKIGHRLKIKDLTSSTFQARLSSERILETITEGKLDASGKERMPSFREKLPEEDRRALVDYIRTLGDKTGLSNAD
jgi:mono/diheme cytochrome c family protein